jgi:putative ribosome biogenesis GTPase RsgA
MRNGITDAQKQGLRDAIESLKLYRRAELVDEDNSLPIIDQLYVDPRPGSEIFRSILKPNTTLIIGRKGTGKSMLFQKLQQELRNSKNAISVY